jgi:hypothetical protein
MDNDSFGIHDRPTSRPGPPWEQPGAFFNRYIETAKGALLDTNNFFATMRRTGGIGAPLTYGMLGVVVGLLGSFLIQMAMPFGGAFPMGSGMRGAGAGIGGLLLGLVVVPCIALVGLFISSGIIHLVLSLLGGARQGFETTFRVIAYTHGSTGPLSIVPFCGGLIGSIWGIVIMIMGLAKAHETTTGKAAGAVLIPVAVCCVLAVVFFAAIMAFVAAAIGGASSR